MRFPTHNATYTELIRVQNNDAYSRDIPPFGIVAIRSTSDALAGAGILSVGGSVTGTEELLINGPSAIAYGEYGAAFRPVYPTSVLTAVDSDYTGTTLNLGESCGPIPTAASEDVDPDYDFKAVRGYHGFTFLAGVSSTVAGLLSGSGETVIDGLAVVISKGSNTASLACAVLTSALSYGSSATADLKHWDGDSWETSDAEVTVYGPPGIDWGEYDLPIGAAVIIAMIEGRWIVINAACPEA